MKESNNIENNIESNIDNSFEVIDDFFDFGKSIDLELTGLEMLDDGTFVIVDKYANGKFITDYVWMSLKQIGISYAEQRKNNALPLFDVMSIRTNCIVMINARLNALANMDKKDSIEYRECAFLRLALKNGWTPSDLEMLSGLFELVYSDADEKEKKEGLELIKRLETTVLKEVGDRFALLNDIGGYSRKVKANENLSELDNLVIKCMEVSLLPTEYASDENFAEFFKKNEYLNPNQQMTKGAPSDNYLDLVSNATLYQGLSDEEKQRIRGKKDYIMAKMSDEELEQFQLHAGHKHNSIKKSNRMALKEVFGEELYDDIDEMHRGTAEERRVAIHHSLGNKYLKDREEVLEIDFAGSGFKEARREYNGYHGKAFKDGTKSTNLAIERQFGKLVEKPSSKKNKNPNKKKVYYSHLRSKNTTVRFKDGTEMVKTRYSIAGPTPDLPIKPGAFNLGEYSIENTRQYGKNFAIEFLTPIFQKWLLKQEEPHNIHINITGHSRGAVAAGESVKLMNEWIKEFEKTHPGAEGFADKVKFNLVLRDPVPGIFTRWLHSGNDLRKVENLNTTLFCSMAQEHTNMAFPLHNVRGAKRIIIGTTEHSMELASTDTSQVLQKGDGKAHLAGFYDSETGEYFRGSGLSEVPDGVYIADDNYNLIRLTSYSQLGKVIDSVYAGKSKQGRVDIIHNMVRNWFLDNDLQMSFANEDAREEAYWNNKKVQDKILASKNKRLVDIQREIKYMRGLQDDQNTPKEALINQNKKIIEACRAYMKKTKIPAKKEDSIYRMNLVSDLISYTMRENNSYKADMDREKGLPENELDAKIRKHQNRLENKNGALDRKLERETMRLNRDERILDYVKGTVRICKSCIDLLKKTSAFLGDSEQYTDFYLKLKEGTRLGKHTTVNQFKKYLDELKLYSERYEQMSTLLGDPITQNGKIRTNFSRGLEEYGRGIGEYINAKSVYMPDKDKPIGEVVAERKANIAALEQKGAKMPEVKEESIIKRASTKPSNQAINTSSKNKSSQPVKKTVNKKGKKNTNNMQMRSRK